jgi:hypothetical protein
MNEYRYSTVAYLPQSQETSCLTYFSITLVFTASSSLGPNVMCNRRVISPCLTEHLLCACWFCAQFYYTLSFVLRDKLHVCEVNNNHSLHIFGRQLNIRTFSWRFSFILTLYSFVAWFIFFLIFEYLVISFMNGRYLECAKQISILYRCVTRVYGVCDNPDASSCTTVQNSGRNVEKI